MTSNHKHKTEYGGDHKRNKEFCDFCVKLKQLSLGSQMFSLSNSIFILKR